MIKVVLFDLYGTLAGFSPSRYEIQSTACADFGLLVSPEGILKGYADADAYMAEQNAIRPIRLRDEQDQDKFFAEYERLVLRGAGLDVTSEDALVIWRRVRQIPCKLTCFDDTLPTMGLLKSRGLILGLVSNINRDGNELTEDLGLKSYLDFAVTSGEVESEKPHPPIFLAALARAGAKPHEVVHVGDQVTSDVAGARGVGINPVLLDRAGVHKNFRQAPRIGRLVDLLALLDMY